MAFTDVYRVCTPCSLPKQAQHSERPTPGRRTEPTPRRGTASGGWHAGRGYEIAAALAVAALVLGRSRAAGEAAQRVRKREHDVPLQHRGAGILDVDVAHGAADGVVLLEDVEYL